MKKANYRGGHVSTETDRKSSIPSRISRGRTSSFGAVDAKGKSNISTIINKGINNRVTNAAPIRNSLLGINRSTRNSSLARASISTADSKREIRPIHDKFFQQKCITKLVEFLDVNNYPHALTEKTLLSPTNKEFHQIFQFLYGFVDRCYSFGTKMEEEIPALLKELKYPIIIQRSHIISVGSSRSWPVLLSALDWLRNLITQGDSITCDPFINDFSAPLCNQLYAQFNIKAYNSFLLGKDNFGPHYEELRAQIRGNSYADMETIEKENDVLVMKVQSLQSEQDQLPALEKEIEMATNDDKKFNAYLEELKKHIECKKQQTMALKVSVEQEEAQLKEIITDNEHKKQIIKVQEVNHTMYEEMRRKHEELINQRLQLETEIKDIVEANGNCEIEISRIKEEIDAQCKSYNSLCRQVRLIPITEPFAENQDFELRFAFGKDMSGRIDQIKSTINKKMKEVKDENHNLTKQSIDLENCVMRLTDMMTEGEQEILEKTQKIKVLNKEVEDAKEVNLVQIQQSEAELAKIDEELRMLNKRCRRLHANELQTEHKEMKDKLSKVKFEVSEHMKTADKFYNTALQMNEEFNSFMEKKILKKRMKSLRKVKTALL